MKLTVTVHLVDVRLKVYDTLKGVLETIDRRFLDGENFEKALEKDHYKLLETEVLGAYAANLTVHIDAYGLVTGTTTTPITPGEPEETESEE